MTEHPIHGPGKGPTEGASPPPGVPDIGEILRGAGAGELGDWMPNFGPFPHGAPHGPADAPHGMPGPFGPAFGPPPGPGFGPPPGPGFGPPPGPFPPGMMPPMGPKDPNDRKYSDNYFAQPNPTEVLAWTTQPWLAAPYLARDPETPPEIAQAALQWLNCENLQPPLTPMTKEEWKIKNAVMVNRIASAVRKARERYAVASDVVRGTRLHLKEMQEQQQISWVERLFTGVKRFVVDDFGKHPAMSVGAVLLGWAMYRMLKGTRAGTAVLVAGGLSLGYHFLRDQFGWKPGETIAKVGDFVSPAAGEAIRTTMDTAKRAFLGPEGANSVFGYYFDKLKIKEDPDQLLFVAFMQENPAVFFKWYDEGCEGDMPDGVRAALGKNQRTLSYFDNMDEAEKQTRLNKVANAYFAHVATTVPDAGFHGSGDAAAAGRDFIKAKYVSGAYFVSLYGEFANKLEFSADHNGCEPRNIPRCKQLAAQARDLGDALCKQTQNGAPHVSFLDVVFAEASTTDWKKFKNFQGLGLDLATARALIGNGLAWTIEGIDSIFHGGMNFFVEDKPNHFPDLMRKGANSFWDAMDFVGLQPEDFTKWYNEWWAPAMGNAEEQLKALKQPVGQVVGTISRFLGEGAKQAFHYTVVVPLKIAGFVVDYARQKLEDEVNDRAAKAAGKVNVGGNGATINVGGADRALQLFRHAKVLSIGPNPWTLAFPAPLDTATIDHLWIDSKTAAAVIRLRKSDGTTVDLSFNFAAADFFTNAEKNTKFVVDAADASGALTPIELTPLALLAPPVALPVGSTIRLGPTLVNVDIDGAPHKMRLDAGGVEIDGNTYVLEGTDILGSARVKDFNIKTVAWNPATGLSFEIGYTHPISGDPKISKETRSPAKAKAVLDDLLGPKKEHTWTTDDGHGMKLRRK